MYHDQGHIPLKVKGFVYNKELKKWDAVAGVNVTLGIPVIRVSVDKFIGKSVEDINLRKHFGLNIIAIENNDNVNDIISPDYKFKQNDILFLSGSKDGMLKLSVWSKK